MSTVVPKEVRENIRQKIWAKADDMGWSRLTDLDRAAWYENWSRDKEVGGVLAHFMDPRKVRVYIKDSLLKPYLRTNLGNNAEKVLIAAGLDADSKFDTTYDKPHGRLLSDGKIICWGSSRDWKAIVISTFERAYLSHSAEPYAAVLIESGRTINEDLREMVLKIGNRLGLQKVIWIEP